jgi:amino acid permease
VDLRRHHYQHLYDLLGKPAPDAALNRGVVALFLLLLMAFVIWFGKDLMVKVMSFLVFPFIASLVLISLSLIPYWNSAVIDQVNLSDIAFTGHDGILVTVWLGISIMVFSFNFSPSSPRLWSPNAKSTSRSSVKSSPSRNVPKSSVAPAC